MRRMSFSATVDQMHNQTKTVTRRDPSTWKALRPGDQLLAIEKGMGLPKGEKQVPIGTIEIVSNIVEPLAAMTPQDVAREGFPGMTPLQFLDQVWAPLHGSVRPQAEVRRIEFRHVGGSTADGPHDDSP